MREREIEREARRVEELAPLRFQIRATLESQRGLLSEKKVDF